MKRSRFNELKDKQKFINELSKVITNKMHFVDKIELDAFETLDYEVEYEYLVITFKGGGISTRNCTYNSDSANLEEIARLVNGGYYDEVDDYKSLKQHSKSLDELKIEDDCE